MTRFEYLEHTADCKFQAFGNNIHEAFAHAALATSNVMIDISKLKHKREHYVEVKGKDKKALLYNFLEEILFLLDTEGFLPCIILNIIIKKTDSGYILEGTFGGDLIENYETHGDVKAVTYNEMKIKEEKDKTMVQVVLDI